MRLRSIFLALGAIALASLAIAAASSPPLVIANSSPSVPVGLYARTDAAPALGAFVTVRARDVAPAYAAARDFTDDSDRFIKRVAAVRGDLVCADGDGVRIGAQRLHRASHDGLGRRLPAWAGCHRLTEEVFLVGDTDDSFDGRYWGPTPLRAVEAVWRPL